jgi:hypothetical protein
MTALKISKNLLLGMALFAATSALAAEKVSINVLDPVTVAGQHLRPGSYKLQWDGNGPDVQLTILKDNSVVATMPAHLVDRDRPTAADAVVTRSAADGSRTISEIQLHGRKYALDLGEPEQTAATSDRK